MGKLNYDHKPMQISYNFITLAGHVLEFGTTKTDFVAVEKRKSPIAS